MRGNLGTSRHSPWRGRARDPRGRFNPSQVASRILFSLVLVAGVVNAASGGREPANLTSGTDQQFSPFKPCVPPLGLGYNRWTNARPPGGPSARWSHAMAYDVQSERTILYGGQPSTGPMSNETWAYDFATNGWQDMNPSARPSGREHPGIAYDAQSDRLILFGGGNHLTSVYSNETWAYDFETNTWTNMSPPSPPSRRYDFGMVYDSRADRVILFGGAGPTQNNETWAYDFETNAWTRLTPTRSPAPRQAHSMAYDSESDRVLLFGGAYTRDNETWAYDFNANAWTRMNPPTHPTGRWGARMAYDPRADRVVLFGGWDGSYSDETWAYDFNANSWTNLNPPSTPGGLEAPGLVYDSCSRRLVLFGGFRGPSNPQPYSNETWWYRFQGAPPVIFQ
ncbi:MAG: hypothetical protein E6K10_07470 [Methanobacteriota archaeon]|nr:MAG: hypothetical protein E6K10_07470 [Euryarchaeota archaeon]